MIGGVGEGHFGKARAEDVPAEDGVDPGRAQREDGHRRRGALSVGARNGDDRGFRDSVGELDLTDHFLLLRLEGEVAVINSRIYHDDRFNHFRGEWQTENQPRAKSFGSYRKLGLAELLARSFVIDGDTRPPRDRRSGDGESAPAQPENRDELTLKHHLLTLK